MKRNNKLHLSDVLTGLVYTFIFVGSICWLMSCSGVKVANKSLPAYQITCSNDTIFSK